MLSSSEIGGCAPGAAAVADRLYRAGSRATWRLDLEIRRARNPLSGC